MIFLIHAARGPGETPVEELFADEAVNSAVVKTWNYAFWESQNQMVVGQCRPSICTASILPSSSAVKSILLYIFLNYCRPLGSYFIAFQSWRPSSHINLEQTHRPSKT